MAAVALMWLVGGGDDAGGGMAVTAIDDTGLHTEDLVVPWSAVWRVAITSRRILGRTWYGFDVAAGGVPGGLRVDGPGGLGEALLSHAHRLPGFDHDAVTAVVLRRRTRAVCYGP